MPLPSPFPHHHSFPTPSKESLSSTPILHQIYTLFISQLFTQSHNILQRNHTSSLPNYPLSQQPYSRESLHPHHHPAHVGDSWRSRNLERLRGITQYQSRSTESLLQPVVGVLQASLQSECSTRDGARAVENSLNGSSSSSSSPPPPPWIIQTGSPNIACHEKMSAAPS